MAALASQVAPHRQKDTAQDPPWRRGCCRDRHPARATAGSANTAGTPRCQENYVTSSTTTAEFDANEPAGAYDQWRNVWNHHYTVTVKPDGTFAGTGVVNGDDGTNVLVNAPETISGSFSDGPDADTVSDHVTYTATRNGITYNLTNSLGTGEIAVAGIDISTPEPIKFVVSVPVFTTVTSNGVTDFANHGEYVTAMGGGSIAAQKCAGMPLVSKQGQ